VGTKSNRDGLGARIEITADGAVRSEEVRAGSSFESSSDPRIHFGLGSAMQVDAIVIHWPSGQIDKLGPEVVDEEIVVQEGHGVIARNSSQRPNPAPTLKH
jgi:tRNA (Thr-GGU) A37 N-methylase